MSHRFRTADRATPAAQQRITQYNSAQHKAEKEKCRAQVAAGLAHCWRCGRYIPPGSVCGRDWQTGHDDHDRTLYRGVECARCNRGAAARAGNRAQRQDRPPRPRKPPAPRRWT